jgi:hypothetical protein
MILEAAMAHGLYVMNTAFPRRKKKLFTYESNGRRSQIDNHICCEKRTRKTV